MEGSLSSSCTAGARQRDPTTAEDGKALHVPSHLQDVESEESKAHARA